MKLGLLTSRFDPTHGPRKHLVCTLRFSRRPKDWQLDKLRQVRWINSAQMTGNYLVVTVVVDQMPRHLRSDRARAFCEMLAAVMER